MLISHCSFSWGRLSSATVYLPVTAKGFLLIWIRIYGRIISSSCLPLVCKPQSPAVDWSWLRIALSLYTFVGSFFMHLHLHLHLLPYRTLTASCCHRFYALCRVFLFLFSSTCQSNLSGKLVKRALHSASLGCTVQCVCARQTCTVISHGLKCTLLTHTPAEAGAEEESHPLSNTRWIAQLRLLYGSRTQRDFLEHIAASVAPHIVLHTHTHTQNLHNLLAY